MEEPRELSVNQQASNRINNSTDWEYDSAGNLLKGQNENGVWQRFEYDAAGRLVVIKDDSGNVLETYVYGASRNRLKKVTASERTYYAWGGNTPLIEYTEPIASSTPAFSKSYVYAGSRLLSTTDAAGTRLHHPDRLGTGAISAPSLNQYTEHSTLPFGTAIAGETSGATNQTFTSYDRSSSTGLDYAVNRTYSQGQSRFTRVDRIGMAAASVGNPQSNNLYGYVQNMPVDFTDPLGLFMVVCRTYDRSTVDLETQIVTIREETVCEIYFYGGPGPGGGYPPTGGDPRSPGGDPGGGGAPGNPSSNPTLPINDPTDCEVFVNMIVSAVEHRARWFAAKARIGGYFGVLTHKYLSMENKVVTGFKGSLTAGAKITMCIVTSH